MHEERKGKRWLGEKPVGDLTFGRLYVSHDDAGPEVYLLLYEKEAVFRDGELQGFKPRYFGDMRRNAVALSGMNREEFHELVDAAFDEHERIQKQFVEDEAAQGRRRPYRGEYAPYIRKPEPEEEDDLRVALRKLLGL
jgi:hypothetical protein